MMYSAYKLNKQGDDIQLCCTTILILNQSIVPCSVLTVISWPSYRFLKRQVKWPGIHLSIRIFRLCCDSHSQRIYHSQWSRSRCFSGTPLLLYYTANVGNLILGSSALSKASLSIWKLLVHIVLKPSFKDFEHNLANMWNECNCAVVQTFFGIALLWDWNENGNFPALCPPLSCPNVLTYWVQQFNSIIFRIFNSSAGILSPPQALFIVIFPKAHLTSHSKISGSRWVTTPSWLSRSLRLLFSTVFLCSFHLLLNSSASVMSLPFMSCIISILAWNIPLIFSIFLKRSLVFPFYCFPHFFAFFS